MSGTYIHGSLFKSLATYTFGEGPWPEKAIVYARADQQKECILQMPHRGRYVLITNMYDRSVTEALAAAMPDSLLSWFAYSVEVQNPRIEAVPLGLAFHEGYGQGSGLRNAQLIPRTVKNQVLLCHGVPTPDLPHHKERRICQDSLEGKPWVTALVPKGNPAFYVPNTSLYEAMRCHPFVVSPSGMMRESMRTWEAIYAGSIPIVERNMAYTHFQDMPLAIVDDWNEITPEWCERKLKELSGKSTERAYMEYWSQRIASIL